MKNKIFETIIEATPDLSVLSDDFYIIGASAMVLLNVNIGDTQDIDILTSVDNSTKLNELWSDKLDSNPPMKENQLFRSTFSRYNFPLMDIEVMGELEVYKDSQWNQLIVKDYLTIRIGELSVKMPTRNELLRILEFFGREKDLKRVELIKAAI